MSQMVVDVEDEELTSDEDVPQFNDEGKEETAAGVTLKKGPWTAAEDAMLVDYVKKNGEGNWNNVQKNTALSRCGKSCRLRWANHLRPNLKKGAFTPEEEELIVKLQHKMGNKWARMAQHLPGRTDNEIKNYWNTRVKRRQRAGLPLYPPELCVQESKESELGRSTVVKIEDRGQTQFSLENSYQECDTFFESMNANLGVFPHYPPILDLSPNSILMNSLSSSQHLDILPSSSPYNTRFHDSTMSFHRSSGLFSNGFHPLPRCKDFPSYAGFTQSLFGYRSLLSLPPRNSMCFSHSLSNCKPSTSMPTIEVVKSELPSFQFRQDTSLPPLHESVYGTPLITSLPKSDHSCNSGLLDDVIHHARHVSSSKNLCSDKSSNSSITAPGEDCYSTFGTTSYESLTVNASKNTFNEQQLAQTLNESFRKAESAHQPWTPISPEEEWAESLIILRDGENYVEMSDSEATLASGEDLARGLDSRPWNNMLGAVGEMSDLP